MGIIANCPSCGLASDEIRCPRCNALKVVGCSGSCALCKSDCESDLESVSCAPGPADAPLADDDALDETVHPGMPPKRQAESVEA